MLIMLIAYRRLAPHQPPDSYCPIVSRCVDKSIILYHVVHINYARLHVRYKGKEPNTFHAF